LVGGDPEKVLTTLKVWKNKGVTTPEQVEASLSEIRALNDRISPLYTLWGKDQKPTASDRTLLTKWTGQWGFPLETVQAVAPYAQGANRPMAYLDSLLKISHEKGLKDPMAIQDELDKGRLQVRPVKTVTQQQYTQRTYREDDSKYMDEFMKGYEE